MTTVIEKKTASKPKYFRTGIARGLSNTRPVERDGGDYGAGIIRGASLITHGEALGHDTWIDQYMVGQVVDLVNVTGDSGLKVRFTHPGLSSDGLGKLTARAKDARLSRDGTKAYADLHIVESARKTPDGDLGSYVMDLAEQDGDMFGTSIVFNHDAKAETDFAHEHLVEVEYTDRHGEKQIVNRFKSPDELNDKSLPHARIGELFAADVVDEPAANPDGLFHRDDIASNATELIEYCLGTRTEAEAFNGIDPERAKQFFNRFLANHDLEVIKMGTDKKLTDEQSVDQFADRKTSAAMYRSEFGDVLGSQYFCDGLTLDEARKEFTVHEFAAKDAEIEELQSKLSVLKEENAGLQKQLAAAKVVGEPEAFDTGVSHDEQPKKVRAIRIANQ